MGRLVLFILVQFLGGVIFFLMLGFVVTEFTGAEFVWYRWFLPIPLFVYAANMFDFRYLKKYSYHVAIPLLLALSYLFAFFYYSYIPGDYMSEPVEVEASVAAKQALWYSLIATVCTVIVTYIVGRIIYSRRKKAKPELSEKQEGEK